MNEIIGKSITQLRECYLAKEQPLPEGLITALLADRRPGARQLGAQLAARREAVRAELQRQYILSIFERSLRKEGYRAIAGVDEAGVGPLAGPVVAAAIILPSDYQLDRLDDSKRLTGATRADLAECLRQGAVAWAIGLAEVEEIDHLNIYRAGLLAMRRAVESLHQPPDYLLIDARRIDSPIPQRGVIRGDSLSASIAAASILAKTTRDAIMIDLDRRYPGYGLAVHKGYATAAHLKALQDLGPLPIHRRSFKPVREALGLEPRQADLFSK